MTKNSNRWPLEEVALQSSVSPDLTLIPGSSERELQLLRLGLVSGRGLSTEDTARLAGELPVAEIKVRAAEYIDKCRLSNKPGTVHEKSEALKKFFWYLDTHGCEVCSEKEIIGFLSHVKNGHTLPGGRWGLAHGPEAARYLKSASRRTVEFYYVWVRSLFRWMVKKDYLLRDPARDIEILRPQKPSIEPFSPQQVEALMRATRLTNQPLRDLAIVLFLYDTGLRADEFCRMLLSDLEFDEHGGKVRVIGKGDKERVVPFGRQARIAIAEHLRPPGLRDGKRCNKRASQLLQVLKQETPVAVGLKVWTSRVGATAGMALSTSGLRRVFIRLGETANIQGVRCSPHTMRHSFAIQYLRNGGKLEVLQELMGHEDIETTRGYIRFAQMDLTRDHRLYSPGDSLGRSS